MLNNYLTTALRNLRRHRFFSFINIFGLAVSMCICMGIMMLIADQMMYDRYNSKRDRIYRVNSIPVGENGGFHEETSTTALPVKQELTENYTGVEKAVRIMRGFANNWLEVDQDVNVPVAGYFADPEILDMFEYDLEYGDSKTALVEPHSIVLTKKASRKLFRQENPLGELIKVGQNGLFKVTGVIRDKGYKTHIAFDALASLSTVRTFGPESTEKKALDYWYNYNNGWVYILLEKGKSPEDIQPHLRAIEKNHYLKLANPDTESRISFKLQSICSITPGPFINNPIGPFFPWIFVYFFGGLAAIVLLTSCFNFTNLSVARSLTRAREIGVRKVTGAARWQIFSQFLAESVLVALCSLLLAAALLMLFRPLLLELSFARMLQWDLEGNLFVYALFVAFAIGTGILAGFFPAVVVSGFQPIQVLKNLSNLKLFSRMGLRKMLLVTQFSFSLLFILTVIVVFYQLQMYLRADHGFTMDHKVIVNASDSTSQVIKAELLKLSHVSSVSAVSHIPAAGMTRGANYKRQLSDKDWINLCYYSVDDDYLSNMNLHLAVGRFFGPDHASNKNFIVLDESAVNVFHFSSPAESLGQTILLQQDSSLRQIIGVVKNYNHQMLMEKAEPMALVYDPKEFRQLQVVYTGSFENIREEIDRAWARVNPGLKVDCRNFSDEVHKIYDIFFGDLVKILTVISVLAIVISCLGLLGMATYTTETRLREISIRKILGGSNRSIIYLLSRGFVSILLISMLIAVPAAYSINNLWLEKLANHVTIDATMILIGVSILALFGALTIGSQTWKAVLVKPVDNLRGD